METERGEAIVLRVQPVTESSLLVTWYCREFGKLKTLAKGARRPKSPMRGKLDLFYQDEIVFLRSRRSDLHLLYDCFLEDAHSQIRKSAFGLAAASYASELVDSMTVMEDPNPGIYGLLSDVLSGLEQQVEMVGLIWFELQVLHAAGWKPAFKETTGTHKVLRALSTTTPAGVRRIKLSAEQVGAAREVLAEFREEHFGRSLRSESFLRSQIRR